MTMHLRNESLSKNEYSRLTHMCSWSLIFTNIDAQPTPEPLQRATGYHPFFMFSTPKRETFLFILSCLSSLYLCGKNATHLRCLQVVRAGGREAWVRRTLRQARDKQERHLWVEAIISHPKDIIPLRRVPLIDNEQQAKTVTSSRKDKTFFHYRLVLIYIKGSTFCCFLPLHHLKFEMNHKKMDQAGLVHCLTERKMRRKFWKVDVTSDLLCVCMCGGL